MSSWIESLQAQWDIEDRRARYGATPCCGKQDYVVIYREGDKAWVRCRRCLRDSKITVKGFS